MAPTAPTAPTARLALATTLAVHPHQRKELCSVAKWCRAATAMARDLSTIGVGADVLILTDDVAFVTSACAQQDVRVRRYDAALLSAVDEWTRVHQKNAHRGTRHLFHRNFARATLLKWLSLIHI